MKKEFMSTKELFSKMGKIVNDCLEGYKTDFIRDKELLTDVEAASQETRLAWFTRDMGTHLVNFSKAVQQELYYDAIRSSWADSDEYALLFKPNFGWNFRKVAK